MLLQASYFLDCIRCSWDGMKAWNELTENNKVILPALDVVKIASMSMIVKKNRRGRRLKTMRCLRYVRPIGYRIQIQACIVEHSQLNTCIQFALGFRVWWFHVITYEQTSKDDEYSIFAWSKYIWICLMACNSLIRQLDAEIHAECCLQMKRQTNSNKWE